MAKILATDRSFILSPAAACLSTLEIPVYVATLICHGERAIIWLVSAFRRSALHAFEYATPKFNRFFSLAR